MDPLDVAALQVLIPCRSLWTSLFVVGIGLVVGIGCSAAADVRENVGSAKWVVFDIPAQPLASALDAYGRATGMASLVDQQLTDGRRSAGVKGVLTPDQALRILIAGTGLSIRYAGESAFTLESAGAAVVSASILPHDDQLSRDGRAYFAELQDALVRVLCRRPETQPGGYRLGVQLWIGPGGELRASHLLDSTGDFGRDAAIVDVLKAAPLAAPPAALQQPVTIVLLPRPANEASDCHERGGRPQ